ncbi:hypothetical protein [Myxococcus sp. AS-1-15]|uniref:Mom family adenine methylcarbamoylation protein n=1 Tax=Myxococcus sp. AS-1-15 TaxID=2874600 RepID=UPI001CBFE52C|nr:hypothetical protein [Myxococcus sp. AS-1-15]MBZ4400389.1 hypothetical protein [Myxococcus sp. AS-1-15]
MMTSCVQRWRDRRATYRPASEPIRASDYEVARLSRDTEARAFVEAHHYSGTYPAARWRFGLHRRGELVGVAVLSQPVNDKALAVFPGGAESSVELGRFVLLDDVPANGETWFLARAFEVLARDGVAGVLTFADPEARTTSSGALVFPGHIGTIYQAHNAVYRGRATPRTLHLLPDGTVFSARAAQKVRAREQGWRYAVAQLVGAGAEVPAPGEDLRVWLRAWLPQVTRRQRHQGNHRYLWGLRPAIRRRLPPSLPYPKWTRGAA